MTAHSYYSGNFIRNKIKITVFVTHKRLLILRILLGKIDWDVLACATESKNELAMGGDRIILDVYQE